MADRKTQTDNHRESLIADHEVIDARRLVFEGGTKEGKPFLRTPGSESSTASLVFRADDTHASDESVAKETLALLDFVCGVSPPRETFERRSDPQAWRG